MDEKQYRLLADATYDTIITINLDGKITYANTQTLKLGGYSQEEIHEKTLKEINQPALHKTLSDYLKVVLGGDYQQHFFETEFVEHSGLAIPIEVNASPVIDDGELRSILMIGRDITKRTFFRRKNQRLLKQQIAVNELVLSMAVTDDLNEIYKIIYDHIEKIVDTEGFHVTLYDPVEKLIHPRFIISHNRIINPDAIPPVPLTTKGGSQSQVLRTGKPLYNPDYRKVSEKAKVRYIIDEDGTIHTGAPSPDEPHVQSALFVPLKDKDRTIGVMQLQSYHLNAYREDDINLLSAVANVAAVAIQKAQLLAESKRRLSNLEALHTIDRAIIGSSHIEGTLDVVLEQVLTQLEVDAALILLYDSSTHNLNLCTQRGFRSENLEAMCRQRGDEEARIASAKNELIQISEREANQHPFLDASWVKEEALLYYLGIPLRVKGQLQGIIEIYHRSKIRPDQEWYQLVIALATQAAIAIDNITLFQNLQSSHKELLEAYDSTLEGWVRALALYDEETEEHTRRVTKMTSILAKEMGINGEDLVHVRRGALLHDIGKMGVSESILNKPGKLNEEEWALMIQHPVHAYHFLSGIEYLRPAIDIPYYHHEKWDGSGYPCGLKGEEIPLAARIFAVVDVWDALCSDRPYRKAWEQEKVIKYIQEGSGTHFDPQVVDVFLKAVDKHIVNSEFF